MKKITKDPSKFAEAGGWGALIGLEGGIDAAVSDELPEPESEESASSDYDVARDARLPLKHRLKRSRR